MAECVTCDYDNCRAKDEITNIKSKLKENDKEFKHFNNLLNRIANHQTQISGNLALHMATSTQKNEELLKSINSLGIYIKDHMKEDSEKQDKVIEAIEELKATDIEQGKKLGIYGLKIHILWAGSITILTVATALFWDLLKTKVGL